MSPRALLLVFAALPWACSSAPPARQQQAHSGPIAVSPDGARLFVAHPDADAVTILGTTSRSIEHEIPLGAAHPAVDPATMRFDPSVMPRALALDSSGANLYVTGQRSGRVYAIDTEKATVKASVSACSEPIGVVVSADDADIFVACAQDDEVLELDAATLAVTARVTTPRKPWTLGWAADKKTLLATHLLGPGVSAFATSPLSLASSWTVADRGPQSDPTEPHGLVRGIYDAVARPGSEEVWVAHMMLGTDTPQPALVFDNTVFPAVSILNERGTQLARLSVQPSTVAAGVEGAFGDVVSGPRSLTFSPDGKYAFVVDADSEDVLVVDAARRVESSIVRPLPGHLPEGAVFFDGELYVAERNTEDVVAFKVQEADGVGGSISLTQDGGAFKSLSADPMPATLRLGQKLFYSANSDDLPITQNHWVACASCHIEGRSDAVTWLFEQGPRDTPTNAGGMIDTGFLFRTADRSKVQDYWKTIDVEQGGHFAPGGAQQPLLDAVTEYVNYAIPSPVPPSTDAAHQLRGDALTSLRAKGAMVFERVGCSSCHYGPAKTDSGAGNPTLDLGGTVLLHDVGTCATAPFADAAHDDIDGHPRAACAFDTPALRGLTDSAPYFHDGSAAHLEDVLPAMLRAVAGDRQPPTLSAADQDALVEYLRSL